MPIRFRCQHCNQLLGISRRKAGNRVECPSCHASLLVPSVSSEPEPAAAVPRPAAAPAPAGSVPPPPPPPLQPAAAHEPVFERSDFDQLLHGPANDQAHQPP